MSRVESLCAEPSARSTRLDDLPRTGWVLRGVRAPETVAEHVLGLQWLCLALAPRCGVDPARAVALALVHDAPEALLGDWPRSAAELLPAGAKRVAEDAAAARLLAPLGPAAGELWSEWREQRTDAARFVKACDRLQLGVRLLRQLRAGQRGLDEFLDTVRAADLGGFAELEELRTLLVAECARTR
jgi:putative hydrolase of HD superfamily